MSTLPKGHRIRESPCTLREEDFPVVPFGCAVSAMSCLCGCGNGVWLSLQCSFVSSSKLKIFVFNFKGSFWEQLVIFLPEEFNSFRKEGMGCASWRAFTAAGMSIKHCTASSSGGATKAILYYINSKLFRFLYIFVKKRECCKVLIEGVPLSQALSTMTPRGTRAGSP